MRTSRLPIFARAMVDGWRSLLGWTIGVLAALLLYLPLFPSLGGAHSQMGQLLKTLPPALVRALNYQDITTGSGYVESTFFGLLGLVLIVIAATAWGSAALAGAEEDGSLELTLAHATSRQRVVLERTMALVVQLVWLTVVSILVILALNPSAQLKLTAAHVIAAAAAWLGLGLLSASLALAVGALSGRRIFATAAGAAVAVLGYALNAIGNQNSDLAALKNFSPYGWAFRHTPLATGADWGGLLLLYGFSAVFVVIAVIALRRRDISG